MNEKERRKLRKFVIFRSAQDLSRMFAGQSSTHETNSLHWPLTYAESKVLCNYETDQAELSKETVTRIIHQDSTLMPLERLSMIIITGCSSRLFQAQQLKTDFQSHVHILYISLATDTMSLDSPFCFSRCLMSKKRKKSNAMITFLFY